MFNLVDWNDKLVSNLFMWIGWFFVDFFNVICEICDYLFYGVVVLGCLWKIIGDKKFNIYF